MSIGKNVSNENISGKNGNIGVVSKFSKKGNNDEGLYNNVEKDGKERMNHNSEINNKNSVSNISNSLQKNNLLSKVIFSFYFFFKL